jgi:hypothetical protein
METVEKPLLHPNSVSAHKTVKVIVVVLQSFIMLADEFLDLGGCWNSKSTTMSTDYQVEDAQFDVVVASDWQMSSSTLQCTSQSYVSTLSIESYKKK